MLTPQGEACYGVDMNNGTAITTPEGIAAFRLATIIRALEFEVQTGMKMSRVSALAAAKRDYGIKARTKQAAIVELRAIQEGG